MALAAAAVAAAAAAPVVGGRAELVLGMALLQVPARCWMLQAAGGVLQAQRGRPGAAAGPYKVKLIDGSEVTYSWYRFVDQPSFQQYNWSEAKKDKLQAFIEKVHAQWPIDRDYMAPPTMGELVALDSALLVTPPKGMELGYVPIVTNQKAALK